MKLVFISNYISHHQVPFCTEMVNRYGEDFKFIASIPIEQEKLDLGYADENRKYPYIVRAYESGESYAYAQKLALESEVVIQGGSSTEFIKKRLETTDKLTFRYIERLFKDGYWRLLSPFVVKSLCSFHTKYRNKNFYLLCAGGYVANDCKILKAYPNKMYKWGYFPETVTEDIDALINQKAADPVRLMWAGRCIDWKHCEYTIEIARKLKENGYNFVLNIVGTGELLEKLKLMAKRYDLLDKYVFFKGSMPPEKVREEMRKTAVYLFTSDYNEGWGAVLNESMNSGCAVVVSHAIGAVPFLVRNGENALIYKSGDINDLYEKTVQLIGNADLRKKLGKNAYETVNGLWNAAVAAERFTVLADEIRKNGYCDVYSDGPCSREYPTPQHSMYRKLTGK